MQFDECKSLRDKMSNTFVTHTFTAALQMFFNLAIDKKGNI